MTAVIQQLRIPRVFHRIWFGGPLPAREQALGETWARHHPGWELRLWREEDVPPLVNQAAFDAATTMAQKADIFRYELLLAHGGVYVDTDFECFRDIEPLLGGVDAFCAREDGFRASIGLLGCEPGHPFFAAVVAALADSVAWLPDRPPNEQTGPELLTRTLIEQDALGRPVPSVFGPELFYPYHWTEPHRAGDEFPDAYAAHHWAKSWHVEKPVAPLSGTAERILVTVDPDLVEAGAAVLSGALDAASSVPGTELALVVKGVPEATEAVGDAVAGVMLQLADGRDLPDIVVYGEPEGSSLPAKVRVELSTDPAENARSLRALGRPAPVPAPAPAASPPSPSPAHAAVYVGGGRVLVRTVWGDKLYCDGADMSLTPDLVLNGAFDPALCGFVRSWLRPGDTAFDVGANIGALTVLMARTVGRQGRVLAYEASPRQAALLRDNVAVNYYNDWVEVREQAAWSRAETLTFHLSERFQGNGSLLRHDDWYAGHFRVDRHDEVTVDAVPLDPVLLEHRPRLVKIDVEGAEADVLAGMAGWLAGARDVAIAVEVVRNRMGERWPAFAEQLAGLVADGWRLAVIQQDGSAAPVDLSLVLKAGWFDNVALLR
ncbi:FkbM family methyltransferase [Dactylosporangium roseum]|uniref:FkbM family methyltransferase n=1 Tax=Dactylosporangium roseum TaxID=47989 RepID=A0ABY5Z0P4_9ACTN|nr:FkbM family methyltransferase [Dactylosporangium roseum]UWZ35604.1 FkbM family methyltransferase [Dactylosporangium roseum]